MIINSLNNRDFYLCLRAQVEEMERRRAQKAVDMDVKEVSSADSD
jgi:hypothetical protein